MEDDIEIEEHDVLDNPLIKNIFPDISTLKKEITDFETVLNTEAVTVAQTPLSTSITCHLSMKSLVDGNPEKPINKNKIIIGTKPNININNEETGINNEHNDKEYYEKHVKPYNAKVLIKNIAVSLHQSSNFCQICKILFSTRYNFEKHKTKHHSKCSHSTNKTTLNQGRIVEKTMKTVKKAVKCGSRNVLPEEDGQTGSVNNAQSIYCRHCCKNFPSQQSLIDHIYKVLRTEPEECGRKNEEDLTEHKKHAIYRSPRKCHTDKEYQVGDFIKQANVIFDENFTESNNSLDKTVGNQPNCSYKNNSIQDIAKSGLKRSDNEKKRTDPSHNHSNRSKKIAITYFCCDNCKCFVNRSKINMTKLSVHLEGRCLQIGKQVCKICGLLLTQTSIRSHLKLHKQFGLRLQDLLFCDFKTKRKIICPSAPSYFECKICAVHFMSMETKAQHICSDSIHDYLTCPTCQIKLSEAAFKLHVPFHMYTLKSKDDKLEEQCNSVDHGETNKIAKITHEQDSNKMNICLGSGDSIDVRNILYKCLSCYITVDTYDKVVEHCQEHYSQNERQISTVICKNCNLSFEDSVYSCHKKLHLASTTNFTMLLYDIFYFRFSNDVWKKHLFKNISKNHMQQILDDSIYKFEARIKMDVIQSGKSDLTVFKCDKCQCFIDYPCLFSHADNSCFKLRPHSCTFCGLNFISLVSRTHHEKIHKNQNITSKSYRIILFNQEKDYDYNKSISSCNYDLLYQCRNCSVTGSKALLKFHECSAVELKQCSECGLLLSNDEFMIHMDKHKELESYNHRIIKVVLVGVNKNAEGTKSVSTFKGTVYDYTYFECSECNICFKKDQLKLEHICSFGSSKSICPICNLYYSTHSIKNHIKLHNTYPDYTRENIRLVKYIKPAETCQEKTASPGLTLVSTVNDDGVIIMKSSMNDDEMDEDVICLSDDADSYDTETEVEKVVSLFKCACGLHFLTLDNMEAHRKTCNKARISKQNCSKCGLLFTPKELFDHLVNHHSNKNCIFTYTIVT